MGYGKIIPAICLADWRITYTQDIRKYGCLGSYGRSNLQALSAGWIGCAPNDIQIKEFQKSPGGVDTWKAICGSKVMYCNENGNWKAQCSRIAK